MNKEKFLAYFKKKSQNKDETDGIQITNVLTSVAENVASAEIAYAEEEMQKTYHQKISSRNSCEDYEDWPVCRRFWYCSAIKKFTTKYPKYSFIRTTVNTWKKKCNDGD